MQIRCFLITATCLKQAFSISVILKAYAQCTCSKHRLSYKKIHPENVCKFYFLSSDNNEKMPFSNLIPSLDLSLAESYLQRILPKPPALHKCWSLSRLTGRFIRDSRISGFLFRLKIWKIEKKRFFRSLGSKYNLVVNFDFLYMITISDINHHFLALSPLKPLKSRQRFQNLLGEPIVAHSEHQGPVSVQYCH